MTTTFIHTILLVILIQVSDADPKYDKVFEVSSVIASGIHKADVERMKQMQQLSSEETVQLSMVLDDGFSGAGLLMPMPSPSDMAKMEAQGVSTGMGLIIESATKAAISTVIAEKIGPVKKDEIKEQVKDVGALRNLNPPISAVKKPLASSLASLGTSAAEKIISVASTIQDINNVRNVEQNIQEAWSSSSNVLSGLLHSTEALADGVGSGISLIGSVIPPAKPIGEGVKLGVCAVRSTEYVGSCICSAFIWIGEQFSGFLEVKGVSKYSMKVIFMSYDHHLMKKSKWVSSMTLMKHLNLDIKKGKDILMIASRRPKKIIKMKKSNQEK